MRSKAIFLVFITLTGIFAYLAACRILTLPSADGSRIRTGITIQYPAHDYMQGGEFLFQRGLEAKPNSDTDIIDL